MFTTLFPKLVYQHLIPDAFLRLMIRTLLHKRLKQEFANDNEKSQQKLSKFIEIIKRAPLALSPDKANQQHYEVSAAFFKEVLGDHLKYSSCYWDNTTLLTDAEDSMLKLSAERAILADGMNILELGCGWGSMSLWMAKKFPNATITGLSNSHSQREFIEKNAKERGLKNIKIITTDMNSFSTSAKYDRIISIEMFEHMRNWELLFSKISSWLNSTGKLFFHVFCHKSVAYAFEEHGRNNWMGRYFFSGGMMPSDSLPLYFQKDLKIEEHWHVNGEHYAKTAKAWHENLVRKKTKMKEILADIYGKEESYLWFLRWKLFFMACEELFGYKDGEEWFVSHYRFSLA